jgi:hypothetical protein
VNPGLIWSVEMIVKVAPRKNKISARAMFPGVNGPKQPPSPPVAGEWREWLAPTPGADPAELAALRLDLEAWIASLPDPTRRLADLTLAYHDDRELARYLGITRPKVGQLRREPMASWSRFQGEDAGG